MANVKWQMGNGMCHSERSEESRSGSNQRRSQGEIPLPPLRDRDDTPAVAICHLKFAIYHLPFESCTSVLA